MKKFKSACVLLLFFIRAGLDAWAQAPDLPIPEAFLIVVQPRPILIARYSDNPFPFLGHTAILAHNAEDPNQDKVYEYLPENTEALFDHGLLRGFRTLLDRDFPAHWKESSPASFLASHELRGPELSFYRIQIGDVGIQDDPSERRAFFAELGSLCAHPRPENFRFTQNNNNIGLSNFLIRHTSDRALINIRGPLAQVQYGPRRLTRRHVLEAAFANALRYSSNQTIPIYAGILRSDPRAQRDSTSFFSFPTTQDLRDQILRAERLAFAPLLRAGQGNARDFLPTYYQSESASVRAWTEFSFFASETSLRIIRRAQGFTNPSSRLPEVGSPVSFGGLQTLGQLLEVNLLQELRSPLPLPVEQTLFSSPWLEQVLREQGAIHSITLDEAENLRSGFDIDALMPAGFL